MSGGAAIVHVVPADGIGGVETAARSLAERGTWAGEHSFELTLIAGDTLASAGAAVVPSPYRSADNPLAHLRVLRRVLARPPQVLIVSLWRSAAIGLIARLLRPSLRLVYFLHVERAVHLPDRLLSALAIRFADAIWCDADATRRQRLGRRELTKSHVISFVTARFQPLRAPGPAAPRFVLWARLNRQKGIDRAIALVALLAEQGIDARFDVYGPDDGELAALTALAAQRGVGDRIRFPGPARREDLPGIAAGASFFLQLSRFEGMAMASVEAMQLGLIPVVTAVGEVGRYVEDGGNGILVDPERLDAAAARVKEVLADPARALVLQTAAIATWHDRPLYADDVLAAAERLIGGTAAPAVL